jgi:hypothetical protein
MSKRILIALAAIGLVGVVLFGPSCQQQYTAEESELLASRFVLESPTFQYDGIPGTLEPLSTEEIEGANSWRFTYAFQSRHAGYGDRTLQMVAQVITPHKAEVEVAAGSVTRAVLDGKWDMMSQKMLGE